MARHTRKAHRGSKGTRKMSDWNRLTMSVYAEMKKKHGKKYSFSDALKEAARRKKSMKH